MAATRSPSLTWVTLDPTSTTVAENSWPRVTGKNLTFPSNTLGISEPHTPQYSVLINTSSGPHLGMSRSTTRRSISPNNCSTLIVLTPLVIFIYVDWIDFFQSLEIH